MAFIQNGGDIKLQVLSGDGKLDRGRLRDREIFDPLMMGTVPVYLGAPNIEQFAPGDNAYIHIRDFSGPGELAGYLNYLDSNDAAYRQLLEWRQKPLRQSFQDDFRRRGCEIANLLTVVNARLNEGHPRKDTKERHCQMSFDPYLARPRSFLEKLRYVLRRALKLRSEQ